MVNRTYSKRERFLFALSSLILVAMAGFGVYVAINLLEARRSILFWVAIVSVLSGLAVCLKITVTGRSTRALEQDAWAALAGEPLGHDKDERP